MQATATNHVQSLTSQVEKIAEETLEQAAQLRELTALELTLVGGGTCAVVFA